MNMEFWNLGERKLSFTNILETARYWYFWKLCNPSPPPPPPLYKWRVFLDFSLNILLATFTIVIYRNCSHHNWFALQNDCKLTNFMPVVSFYTHLNSSENLRFSDFFRGYRKTCDMKWVNYVKWLLFH